MQLRDINVIYDIIIPAVIMGILSLTYFSGIDYLRKKWRSFWRKHSKKDKGSPFDRERWYKKISIPSLISGVMSSCLLSYLALKKEHFGLQFYRLTFYILLYFLLIIILNSFTIGVKEKERWKYFSVTFVIALVINLIPVAAFGYFLAVVQ